MKLNTRFLLLASPIYLIITIYLISVSHSVYEFPKLTEKLQKGYFQQELMNVQRDLIFLESALEEGHQQYYSTLTQMMAFYKEILEDSVLFPCTFEPILIDFGSNNHYNHISSQLKNNQIPKMYEMFQLASAWYSTKSDQFDIIMNQLQIKHPHFRKNMGFLMNYIESIIYPYWHQQALESLDKNNNIPINCKDEKNITNQSICQNDQDTVKNNDKIKKVMLNSISGAGIYLPKDDLMVFSPIPQDNYLGYLKEQSVVSTLTNKCRSLEKRIDNPNKKFCLDEEPTMYLTRNEFGKGSISGGLSLKFSYNLGQKSEQFAILYVEFTQSNQFQDMITDQLKSVNGIYFITFNDKINTLASFSSKSNQPNEHLEPTLSAQLFGQDSDKQEKDKFEEVYQKAIDTLMKREKNEELIQKKSTPIQFWFNRKKQKNYCLVAPIEIDLNTSSSNGNGGTNGATRIEPYTIFFLGYIVSESELLESFNSTKEQIEFIKLIPFIIIILLCLVLIYFLVRKSKQIQLSYVNQIKTLALIMNEIDPNKIDSGDQLYEEFSTSQEVESLYRVMKTLLKNFKYSHQKFNQDEALILLELSQAKQFYTSLGNNSRVGICCNNIGNIHMQNDRFLEAISEYQEAILMASIEINEAVSDLQKIEQQQVRSKSVSATRFRSDSQKNQGLPPDISNLQLNSPEDPSKKMKLLKSRPKVSSLKNNQIKKQKQSQGNLVTFDSQQLIHRNEVLETEMHGRSRLSSNNTTEINETSDQSNPTKARKKLIEKLRISRTRLLNRMYQLGLALFEYSTREKSDLLYEAVSVFNQCLTLSDSEIHSETVIIRNILILTKKAFIHTTLGQYSLAKLTIQKARQELSVLKEIFSRIDVFSREKSFSSSGNEYLNVFGLFPVEVLKSKIDLQEAVLELMQFNYRRSAIIFRSILQGGERYDSQVRKFALESLRNILQNFKVTRGVDILEFQLEKFEKKTIEVIMLIDYSKAMTQNQIITSHLRSKRIFDVLQDSDKIGFVSFNNSIHVNFPMQKKKLYNDLLEKKIRSITMSSGGVSDLQMALEQTAKLFERQDQNPNKNKKDVSSIMKSFETEEKKSENLRFICLFTEGNNQINKNDLKIMKEILKQKRIQVLIMNICSQNANMLFLRNLANELSDFGNLFQLDDNKIEMYLQNIHSIQTKPLFIREYF